MNAESAATPVKNQRKLVGRIVSADEGTVQLEVGGSVRALAFGDVSKALVQVELNRPSPKIDTNDGEED